MQPLCRTSCPCVIDIHLLILCQLFSSSKRDGLEGVDMHLRYEVNEYTVRSRKTSTI